MVKTCLQSTISCSAFLYLSALFSSHISYSSGCGTESLRQRIKGTVPHLFSLGSEDHESSKTVARVKIGWQHLTTTMYTYRLIWISKRMLYHATCIYSKYNIYSKYKQLNLVGHSQSWNLLPLIARVSDSFQHLFVSLPVICGSGCFQKIQLTISFQLLLCHGAIFKWLPICRNPQQAQNNIAAS